ncbi:GNAT family N-acetyltransferase [Mycobacteroides abscessus]|nr:GNAT family N-acetyltransferase [Mycobacteroides abscessus]EHM18306.1 hypothetical protein MMAS_27650 [Mycobacteroides abscessus subsp. massiliense CCUG 48898 = JCM 15300]AMU66330.1 GNAT family acetyltransferase [Mycobacteroides abscessus]ANN99741.1 GNAT family acetyltransferase [Mycobacteroides abscessus]ARQ65159.1 N-acetyltransferase [Mycobacteroides abscessus subsp. massiliense]ORA90827.1 N-acetyltransferase [Mycobacteroides abscessus subsp. massiliense]
MLEVTCPRGSIVMTIEPSQAQDPAQIISVNLLDGTTVTIRPLVTGDFEAVMALHTDLSARETYFRFFTEHPSHLTAMAHSLTHQDDSGCALGAFEYGQLLGIVSYGVGEEPFIGEVALVVDHHHHMRGIGSVLLRELARAALHNGLRRLTGEVLTNNHMMIEVLGHLGWHSAANSGDSGVILVSFDLTTCRDL